MKKLLLAAIVSILFVPALAQEGQPTAEAFTANLQPVNPDLTDERVDGLATLVRTSDRLYITVFVTGVAPDMMHLMHLHGFPEGGQEASCPSGEADTNDDGVVDLIEAVELAGQTLIPFNDAPAGLQILSQTYPNATDNGVMIYRTVVDLAELTGAVEEQFGMAELDLGDLSVMVHGVPEGTELPDTAQSLPEVPAITTIPVACGALQPI